MDAPVDLQRATAETLSLVREVCELMKPVFPHHASALLGEITGTRMNDTRWNRVVNILRALSTLPGVCFNEQEHRVRNLALCVTAVAQKMATACVGVRDPQGAMEFAVWLAADIRGRMSTQQQTEKEQG